MEKSALARFEKEFRGWVDAYNEAQPHTADADELLRAARDRIGDERLARIGSAFMNGWLKNEPEPGRGYFVRESDRGGRRGGQFTIGNKGQSLCWELFVQLADYAWLRTVAERHGQTVRLEDDLMDVTVRAGNTLVLYVEHKTGRSTAEKLLDGIQRWGETGVTWEEPPPKDDALRKARYMLRADPRPLFFGLSAIGYQKLFKVEYGEGNRFQLVEDHRPLSAPLADHPAAPGASPKPRSPVDPLAVEIQRLCPEVWISVGTGKTAYNFYGPGEHGDALIVGVYETGELWTDLSALGDERAGRLRQCLQEIGITLVGEKQWAFWRAGDKRLNLADADPTKVAEAVRSTIGDRAD